MLTWRRVRAEDFAPDAAASQARTMIEMLLVQIAGQPAPPPQRLPITLVERGSG
jgi:DNA-binding LacI/PurR family transcriptional regulator